MRDWRGRLRPIRKMLDAGEEHWVGDGVAIQRVTGGNNNALYRVEAEGQAYACKLCRVSRCARFVAATPVKPYREAVARRICRADTNLANAIWNDDGRVRWVDWEYSGWGDPA